MKCHFILFSSMYFYYCPFIYIFLKPFPARDRLQYPDEPQVGNMRGFSFYCVAILRDIMTLTACRWPPPGSTCPSGTRQSQSWPLPGPGTPAFQSSPEASRLACTCPMRWMDFPSRFLRRLNTGPMWYNITRLQCPYLLASPKSMIFTWWLVRSTHRMFSG